MMDQRRFPRYSTILPVDFTAEGEEVSLFYIASNISREGLFIQSPRGRPVGRQLSVTLHLKTAEAAESSDSIVVSGVVAHVRSAGPEPGIGVHLNDLGLSDWKRICAFVDERRVCAERETGKKIDTRQSLIEENRAQLQQDLADLRDLFDEKD